MTIRLLGIVFALMGAIFSQSAPRAATIVSELANSDPTIGVITLVGVIKESDGESFAQAAKKYARAIVVFSSPGGDLFPGLQMGQIIRSRGFATIVNSGTSCASACALAWLGGIRRFVQDSGQVGFHAAANVGSSGERTVSGVGNALIGAYLNRLGLSDRAIVYIEQANPEAITWLTPSQAQNVGIPVEFLPAGAQPRSAEPGLLPNPDEAKVPRTSTERAIAFLTDYYARWSETNDQALTYFQAIYAAQVRFYGSSVSRDKLMGEKRAFAERWPLRIYTHGLHPRPFPATREARTATSTAS